jgi:hypothetical protein
MESHSDGAARRGINMLVLVWLFHFKLLGMGSFVVDFIRQQSILNRRLLNLHYYHCLI